VFSGAGSYERVLPHNGVTGAYAPLGLAFDKAEHLYVTEAFATTKRILVLSTAGNLLRTITTPEAMSFPNGIAIDVSGRLVVTDGDNGRAIFFDQSGKLTNEVKSGMGAGDLGLPRGAAFDSQGHLIVVDTTDQSARVYKYDGKSVSFIGSIGDEGTGDGLFEYPNGAAADGRAHVYITDRVNNRVQVWSY